MKKGFIVVFLVLGLTTQAQQELRNSLGDVYYDSNLYNTKYNAQEGTPYLNEVFTPAKIDNISETKLVRFDAVEGRVEILVNDKKVLILDDAESHLITLLDGSNKQYETKKYLTEKGIPKTSFFELVAKNENYTLYLLERIKFYKAVKAQGYGAPKPAMFKYAKKVYYLTDFKTKSDQLLNIPSKVKNFVALFPGHSKSVKLFIKENTLKIDNEKDLLRIFDFYFDTD